METTDGKVFRSQWSMWIAESVTPDEVGLAPELTERYRAGGGDRRRLLYGARAGSGAAGSAITHAFGTVLHAIDVAGPQLVALLGASPTGNVLNLAALAVGYRAYQLARNQRQARRTSSEMRAPVDSDPVVDARIRAAFYPMVDGLISLGLSEVEALDRAGRLLNTLLIAPTQTVRFVEEISDQLREPGPGTPRRGLARWIRRGRRR